MKQDTVRREHVWNCIRQTTSVINTPLCITMSTGIIHVEPIFLRNFLHSRYHGVICDTIDSLNF